MAREPGALLAHPGLQLGDARGAEILADHQPFGGGVAVDRALDVEQGVDALHGLQGYRRDDRGLAARPAARGLGDVGQLEELAPAMGPTRRLKDLSACPAGDIKGVVAAIGVGLQHACPSGQMTLRVFAATVGRVVEHRRRRRRPGERPVIADIGPTSTGVALALGQDRHGGVVAMQPLGGEHMGLEALEYRLHHGADRAHLVGEGGQAQGHAFAGIALGLAVEGLMLAELLEDDHRQQARAGPAARDHMERRRRLADLLAVAAGEFLAHMLDHLPRSGDRLQRLGDILAELAQARASAAQTGAGSRHDDPLSGQMLRERLAGGPPAREGRHRRGLTHRRLGGDLVLGGRGLQLFELQLHLIQEPGGALGVWPETLTVELGDLQLQMRDQGLVIGPLGAGLGELGLRPRQRRLQRFKVLRGGSRLGVHDSDRIIKLAA